MIVNGDFHHFVPGVGDAGVNEGADEGGAQGLQSSCGVGGSRCGGVDGGDAHVGGVRDGGGLNPSVRGGLARWWNDAHLGNKRWRRTAYIGEYRRRSRVGRGGRNGIEVPRGQRQSRAVSDSRSSCSGRGREHVVGRGVPRGGWDRRWDRVGGCSV